MAGSCVRPAWRLLSRTGNGLLLTLCGLLGVVSPAAGPGLAGRYYGNFPNLPSLQVGHRAAEVLLRLLVVRGPFGGFSFALQSLNLILGAIVVWRYLLAFRDEDRWPLDRKTIAWGTPS